MIRCTSLPSSPAISRMTALLALACFTVASSVLAQSESPVQLQKKAIAAKQENYSKLPRLFGTTNIRETHPPLSVLTGGPPSNEEVEERQGRKLQKFLLDGDSLRVNTYLKDDEIWHAFAFHDNVWQVYKRPEKRLIVTQGVRPEYERPFDPRDFGFQDCGETLETIANGGKLTATTEEKDGELESFTLKVTRDYSGSGTTDEFTFTKANRFLLTQRQHLVFSDEIAPRVAWQLDVTYQKFPGADALFPKQAVFTEFTYEPRPHWLNKAYYEVDQLRVERNKSNDFFTKIEVPEGTDIEK